MLKDFKTFALRGNLIDLAVGVIIGGAFGKIVTSLVNDIIMPPIGLLLNGVNFSDLFISLNGQHYASLAEAQVAGAPTFNYGAFINNIIDFLIIAIVVFVLIRAINRLTLSAKQPEAATTKNYPYCFTSIAIKATRCPNCTSKLE